MESQQECCEKCKCIYGEEFDHCDNKDCPCHTLVPTEKYENERMEGMKEYESLRNPTPQASWEPTTSDLDDPMFNAIWDAIKEWDLERERGRGYAGATGTDVMTILRVVRPFLASARADERARIREVFKHKFNGYGGTLGFTLGDITHALEAGLQEGVNDKTP